MSATAIRRFVLRCAVLLVALVVATGPVLAAAQRQGGVQVQATGQWAITTLAGPGTQVNGQSLALGADGSQHVAYVSGGQLHYASTDGTGWHDEVIDPVANPGPVIAIDGAGEPHIVYQKPAAVPGDGPTAWHAFDTATGWDTEAIGTFMAVSPELAFSASGVPHVAYMDPRPIAGGGGLRHAYRDLLGWHEDTVTSAIDCGLTGHSCPRYSIAVDGSGRPRVAYTNPTDGSLSRAYWNGAAWQIESVTGSGLYPDLAVDSGGNDRLAYVLPGPDVMYGVRGAGGWSLETVDGEMVAGQSLTLDAYGNPHLAYCDVRPAPPAAPGEGLKYAYRQGDAWVVSVVDGAVACNSASLALDGYGNPRIVYYDTAGQTLKYAEWGATTSEAVPTGGGVVTSTADGTTYDFPAGTFTGNVTVTHTTVSDGSVPAHPGIFGVGHSFEVTATDATSGGVVQPASAYTITIQYSSSELAGVDEGTLALYSWNGSAWVAEPTSSCDPATNTITASPNHFSLWAIMGMKATYVPLVR